MANVRFTRNLSRFFPDLAPGKIDGVSTVGALIKALDQRYPGISTYLIEDAGPLRKHVNVFVNGDAVRDRAALGDAIEDSSDVYIAQALSGG